MPGTRRTERQLCFIYLFLYLRCFSSEAVCLTGSTIFPKPEHKTAPDYAPAVLFYHRRVTGSDVLRFLHQYQVCFTRSLCASLFAWPVSKQLKLHLSADVRIYCEQADGEPGPASRGGACRHRTKGHPTPTRVGDERSSNNSSRFRFRSRSADHSGSGVSYVRFGAAPAIATLSTCS